MSDVGRREGDWTRENGVTWRMLTPLGIEIEHELSGPMSDRQQRQLVGLLWKYGLILARGQSLTMERQRDLCASFGPILIRAGENGYLTTNAGEEANFAELAWHADAAYTDAPFDAIALHAVDVVADASSTAFVDARAGLSALPASLRRALEGRRAELISPGYDALADRTCNRRDPMAMQRSQQPAIRLNPHDGGEVLWLSELQAAHLLDMEWEESRILLNAVFDHLYRSEAVFEHAWRDGDFIVWDNIALQHKRPALRAKGRRVLQRVIVGRSGAAPHVIPLAAVLTA